MHNGVTDPEQRLCLPLIIVSTYKHSNAGIVLSGVDK